MSAFSDYLGNVNGAAIDIDGGYGAQCWDLWSHYATNLIGANFGATFTGAGGQNQHGGYWTCNVMHGFDRSGLGAWFTPVSEPQRGDVAIWEYGSSTAPSSHIAIVVEDRGNAVYCMTQNPGPCHYGVISKAGIIGYLRPDNQSFFDSAPAPAPAPAPSAGVTITVEPWPAQNSTLWGISESAYGYATWDTVNRIASANGISDPGHIEPGWVLNIP